MTRERKRDRHCVPGTSADSQRIIASLDLGFFHVSIDSCVDAYYFIFWDLPGDVLAAPESALCGWRGVRLLSLSLLVTREAKRGYDEGFRVPASWIIPLQLWGLAVWLLVCGLKSALIKGTLCYFGPTTAMTCVVPQPTCHAV